MFALTALALNLCWLSVSKYFTVNIVNICKFLMVQVEYFLMVRGGNRMDLSSGRMCELNIREL